MPKNSLARVEEVEEETNEDDKPTLSRGARPFALRFAEGTPKKSSLKSDRLEIFDDPTTVDNTGQYEDPHTDES